MFQPLKALCEYALACGYYAGLEYRDALYHLQTFFNMKNDAAQIVLGPQIELELALIEWHCNASDQAIQTVQEIILKCMP